MGTGAIYFEAGYQTSDSTRRGKFLDSLSNYHLLKQNSSAVS